MQYYESENLDGYGERASLLQLAKFREFMTLERTSRNLESMQMRDGEGYSNREKK